MDFLLSFIDRCKRFAVFQIFTIYLRYLIGGAFLIAAIGMGKLNGNEMHISSPGQPIQDLEPIQQFFRVMAMSGLYWAFIGWSQIIAGILMMTQRFATIGAAIFFGLIVNIFVITVSFDFKGTPIVTGLMLLATVFLLLWDLNRLQYFFRKPSPSNLRLSPPLRIHDHPFWSWTGTFMAAAILVVSIIKLNILFQLVGAVVIGLVAFVVFFGWARRGARPRPTVQADTAQ